MGVGIDSASWDRGLKAGTGAYVPPKVERQCVHFKEGSDGLPYDGKLYPKALQRMKGSQAAKPAGEVEPVF